MKKFLVLIALCATLVSNACWFTPSMFDKVVLWSINYQVRVFPDLENFINNFYVSLPLSVQLKQEGASSPILQAKLQYAVYRKVGNNYQLVVPYTVVKTVGSGSSAIYTTNGAVNYFGSIRIRPDKNIIKSGDYIVIRVWFTNGITTSGDIDAPCDMPFSGDVVYGESGASVGGGWYTNLACCVIWNGEWGAR